MADDLDDEWWLDNKNTEPSSSDEDGDNDDDATEQTEGLANESKCDRGSGKRKAEENEEEMVVKKKRYRKRITDELKNKPKLLGTADDVITTIQQHFKDKLSTVEWDNLELDLEKDFFETRDDDHTPTSYLRTILPKWKKLVTENTKDKGSPVLLVITSSALRAVQINREIADFKGDKCKVVKLFAKHFKLEDQQKYLSRSVCHIGLGTPNRLMALLKSESLHLNNVVALVFDWNWRDIKSKRLCDIPDVLKDLMLLLKDYLVPHVQNSKCKIGLM